MPRITITLEDTPAGGVAIHSDFAPAISSPCSVAQAAALDIIRRTAREYGLVDSANSVGRNAAVVAEFVAAMKGC